MGPSGFLVIIESQAIMVSIRVAIGKLIHALEVWSDDPRLPNIEPLQHEPSTADSTAIQRCIGQYSPGTAAPLPELTGMMVTARVADCGLSGTVR